MNMKLHPTSKLPKSKLLLFAILPIVVIFSIFEITLRLFGFQFIPPSDFALFAFSGPEFVSCIEFDRDCLYRLKPGTIKYFDFNYKINSSGWRGDDFQLTKPPGTIRIIGIGDSNVFGFGLPENKCFMGVLKNSMVQFQKQEHLPFNLEVINCGMIGYSSYQTRKALESKIFGYSPDILIVNIGIWNEGLWAVKYSDREQYNVVNKLTTRGLIYHIRVMQFIRQMIVDKFKKKQLDTLLTMVGYYKNKTPESYSKRRVSYEEFSDDIHWLYTECRKRDITLIFLSGTLPSSFKEAQEPLDNYQKRLFSLAPEPPDTILNIRKMIPQDMKDEDIFIDYCHYKEQIHSIIAQEIFQYLKPIITNNGKTQ